MTAFHDSIFHYLTKSTVHYWLNHPRNWFLEHLKSESMRVSKRHPFMERWNKHVEILRIYAETLKFYAAGMFASQRSTRIYQSQMAELFPMGKQYQACQDPANWQRLSRFSQTCSTIRDLLTSDVIHDSHPDTSSNTLSTEILLVQPCWKLCYLQYLIHQCTAMAKHTARKKREKKHAVWHEVKKSLRRKCIRLPQHTHW